jgi:hypothetical protein
MLRAVNASSTITMILGVDESDFSNWETNSERTIPAGTVASNFRKSRLLMFFIYFLKIA